MLTDKPLKFSHVPLVRLTMPPALRRGRAIAGVEHPLVDDAAGHLERSAAELVLAAGADRKVGSRIRAAGLAK